MARPQSHLEGGIGATSHWKVFYTNVFQTHFRGLFVKMCVFEVFGDCKKVGNFPLFLAAKGKPVLFSLGIKKIGNFPTVS